MSALSDPCSAGKPGAPLSVDAARLRTIAATAPLRRVEILKLENALGRVMAKSEASRVNLPPFDNAAMDGFALRLSDLVGNGPWSLPVTGRTAAGDTFQHVLKTGAIRIFTGAPIPLGADAVVMQERVMRNGDSITITERPKPGLNVRCAGEDRSLGSLPVPIGHVLTAPRLALLAGCGSPQVTVYGRLKVGMLSTGSELCEPGTPLAYGQIYNSNRVMLRALLTLPWIELTDYGILRDDPASIRATLRQAAAQNDIVISSGGMSAGEEDHVLDALRAEDATLDVLKVAIRPGKPLTVGRIGQALFIGLPGNPYAAAVTFSQIARPALRKAAGITEMPDLWLPSVAAFTYDRAIGRREYVPVTWERRDAMGRPVLHRLGRGASASLGPMAEAKGIVALPEDMDHIVPGMSLIMEPLLE